MQKNNIKLFFFFYRRSFILLIFALFFSNWLFPVKNWVLIPLFIFIFDLLINIKSLKAKLYFYRNFQLKIEVLFTLNLIFNLLIAYFFKVIFK